MKKVTLSSPATRTVVEAEMADNLYVGEGYIEGRVIRKLDPAGEESTNFGIRFVDEARAYKQAPATQTRLREAVANLYAVVAEALQETGDLPTGEITDKPEDVDG